MSDTIPFMKVEIGDMFLFNHMHFIKIAEERVPTSMYPNDVRYVNAMQVETEHKTWIGDTRKCKLINTNNKTIETNE